MSILCVRACVRACVCVAISMDHQLGGKPYLWWGMLCVAFRGGDSGQNFCQRGSGDRRGKGQNCESGEIEREEMGEGKEEKGEW